MKDYSSFSITYSDLNRTIQVKNSEYTILQHSISNKIPHLHECGGHGLCTTCRIRIVDGASHVSPPTNQELALRKERNWDPGIRLGCQTCVNSGDVTLERIIWTNAEISNLQMEIIPYGIGEEKELAILFCDMRNFTPLAGKHSNFDLAHMLNRFFTEMGDPIYMNNGVI
jgi:ferredoxin